MVAFTVFQDFQKDKRVGEVKPNHARAERSRQGSESLALSLSLSYTYTHTHTKAVDLLKANRTQHTGTDRGTSISLANRSILLLSIAGPVTAQPHHYLVALSFALGCVMDWCSV
jgi:hypothetical protein